MVQTLISPEEYLATVWHPDVDYVEGRLEDRNVGTKEHGKLQARIWLLLRRLDGLQAFIETRLKVSETRYRIPDVCAYYQEPEESVFTQPPVLCVEILSLEDRLSRVMQVVQDYLSMGVPTVWVLDPLEKKAYAADPAAGLREVAGRISTTDQRVVLTLEEIFSGKNPF